MTENPTNTLNPQIKISNDDESTLPMCHFNAIIVVEPDEEEWAITIEEEDQAVLDSIFLRGEILINDLYPDDIDAPPPPPPPDLEIAEETRLIWLKNIGLNYFENAKEFFMASFRYEDYAQPPEEFDWYLQSAYTHHPEWRIAVIGAMLEYEVTDIANKVQQTGFDTTIVTRYCMTSEGFINMDDLIASIHEQRAKNKKKDAQ